MAVALILAAGPRAAAGNAWYDKENIVFEAEVTGDFSIHSNRYFGFFGTQTSGDSELDISRNDSVLDRLVQQYWHDTNVHLVFLPAGTANSDSVFERVRITGKGNTRDFRRRDAVSGANAEGKYWRWPGGSDVIPTTSGATYTLQFLRPPTSASFEVVFEAEVTVGQHGPVYGYDGAGHGQFGSLDITLSDTVLDRLTHHHRYGNEIYLYLPSGTVSADSVFDRMRISAGSASRIYWRNDAYVGNNQQGKFWRWSGSSILPASAGSSYTLQFSRPPADFSAVYEAAVTSGGASGNVGYDRLGGANYGSLSVSDADPDSGVADTSEHVGEVKGITRSSAGLFLKLPAGVANDDDVFRVMRISRGGHFWDFRRDQAAYRSFTPNVRFQWNKDKHAIPGTGQTFTLALLDTTQADCVWLREWSRCAGGAQTMTPVVGRWTDAGGSWAWAPAPGCTPPGATPASLTRTCGGGCEFQGESSDQVARGNIGCFHAP